VSRADYHLPSSLSKEAQSVIREMLQKDPTRRISLTGLLEHPFFAKSILRLPKLLSGSGISETVPPTSLLPLSTERLRAISKRTKHAQAEITASGQLMLDFDGDKYRMVISGDGGTVKFFDNPEHTTSTPHQSSASSTDMWLFDKKPLRSYRLASLPQKFWKKYQYACRFVDAVKAKTPKVWN
jgi:serine/threonine protein kinase